MSKFNFKGLLKKTIVPATLLGLNYLTEKWDKEKAREERKKENLSDFKEFMSEYQTKTEGDN